PAWDPAAHPGFDWEDAYITPSGLRALLESRNLPSLTHLQLRLSSLGDEGCAAIVRSGILKRLKILDLRHGCITDEGAATLAGCPDLKHLEHLDVDRNGLTGRGIERLKAVGISVRADDQQTPEEVAEREYLFEGEAE